MKERIALWIAWHLPRAVVTWCYVRVAAHATMGPYSNTVLPELTVPDALGRWID